MKQFYYAAGERISAKLNESDSYPETVFEYEPLTVGQKAEVENRLNATSDAVKLRKIGTDVIAAHLREWSVVKSDGTPVDPKNERELNRAVPALLVAISTVIIQGTQGELVEADEPEDQAGKNS